MISLPVRRKDAKDKERGFILTFPAGTTQAQVAQKLAENNLIPVSGLETGPGPVTQFLGRVRAAAQPAVSAAARLAGPTMDLSAVARAIQQRSLDPLTQPAEGFRQFAEEVANPVPGSATELLTMGAAAAAGPAARAVTEAPGILSGLTRGAIRIGAPTLTQAISQKAEFGENPNLQTALIGGTLATAELTGLASRFFKARFGRAALGKEPIRAVRDVDTRKFATAITDEVPVFKRVLNPGDPGTLHRLRDPAKGQNALSAIFEGKQGLDNRVVATLKGKNLFKLLPKLSRFTPEVINNFAEKGLAPAGPIFNKARKSIKAAKSVFAGAEVVQGYLNRLRLLKNLGRAGKKGDMLGRLFQEFAREAEEELVSVLPESLARDYASGLNQYRKGLRILDILKNKKILTGDNRGPFIQLEEAGKFLSENMERIPPSDFPRLFEVVENDIPGARAVNELIIGSERIGGSPSGGFFAGTLPPVSRLTPAGVIPPAPGAGQELINIGALLGRQRARDIPIIGE